MANPCCELRQTGRIEGRLIADQPELARGIPIKIETRQPQAIAMHVTEAVATKRPPAFGTAEVTTDAEGRFVIPEIAEGRIDLSIDGDLRLPVRPRIPDLGSTELKGAETLKLDIPFERCVRVHGLVRVNNTGEPLDGNVSFEYGFRQFEHATTEAKGKYSGWVLPGNVRVRASFGKEYANAAGGTGKAYAVPKGVAEFEFPPIEATPANDVAGTLLDAEGKPLAGAMSVGFGDGRPYHGESDEQGKFSFQVVPSRPEVRQLCNHFGRRASRRQGRIDRSLSRPPATQSGKEAVKAAKAISPVVQQLIEPIASRVWIAPTALSVNWRLPTSIDKNLTAMAGLIR